MRSLFAEQGSQPGLDLSSSPLREWFQCLQFVSFNGFKKRMNEMGSPQPLGRRSLGRAAIAARCGRSA
jgi:hypothetical protein